MTCRDATPPQAGFTLIEVLVALAIIAVALTAALRATGLMAANHRALHDKALALLAAQNAIAQLRLQPGLPRAGAQSQACPQGSLALRCDLTITNTMNRSFRQVNVKVYGPDSAGALIQLDGMVSSLR
ncbi:type II secretion system minor pseudopilin GspI [Bordetella genomosp. 12]|uniref:Type II secretion system protein I n=1 Tax=Bordetella genomosp. 12 TaxID=463035 RepID=A0A261VCR2_9BORD|nr:type II secretion system minor pseudopilin GspI [Bordetella genomosp. 12]OZI71889.1 type II secretion system protein GspI [Bordetella genomosp. 12]